MSWRKDLASVLDQLGGSSNRVHNDPLTFKNLEELVFQLRKPENLRRMDARLAKCPNGEFLNWLADRLVHIYGENSNVDFVLRLREIAKDQTD